MTALLELTEERPWAVFAACRDVDPELFFPGPEGDPSEAIKICRGCAVRLECLEWALDMRERYGVWGGTTERERRRILRRAG